MQKLILICSLFLIVNVFIANGQSPVIDNINPTSGIIGTVVTITGSGFSNSDNTVIFQYMVSGYIWEDRISAVSADGITLIFTIPEYVHPECHYSSTLPSCVDQMYPVEWVNIYDVSVLIGMDESNRISFNVTGGASPTPTNPPEISLKIVSTANEQNLTINVNPPGLNYNYPLTLNYESATNVVITPNIYTDPNGVQYKWSSWIWEGNVTLTSIALDTGRISLLVKGASTLTSHYVKITPVSTPIPTSEPVCSSIIGDVDESGFVDVVDALFIAKYYVGYSGLIKNPCAGDVDKNGQIDIVDALKVAQCYVGLISCAF